MDPDDADVVVPVVREEVHADAVPVETGGVRIIRRPYSHDETVEQELRKGRIEVSRVKTDRVVDGPQPVRHEGNTTIIPVVSEVLKIEKQFVVTEEIYVTQIEERETVRQTIAVNTEKAEIQRFDKEGRVTHVSDRSSEPPPEPKTPKRHMPRSLLR